MSYLQIRDILKRIESYHRTLGEVVRETADRTSESPDAEEWLRNYVETQARAVSDAIGDYEREGEKSILDTWIQYVPLEGLKQQLESLQKTEDDAMGTDELLDGVQGFDRELRDCYQSIAKQSSIPAIHELMTMLSECSQSLLQQKAWGMRNSDDAQPRNNRAESTDESKTINE